MRGLLLTTALVLSTSVAFAEETTGIEDQTIVVGTNNNYEGGSDTNVYHEQGSGDVTTTKVESPTPNGYVSNPNLTTGGSDVCLGSSSGGISGPGFGISGGSTTVDENCVMLKNAKILASLGLKDAAVTLLIISNEKAAEAISLANPELFKTLTKTQ